MGDHAKKAAALLRVVLEGGQQLCRTLENGKIVKYVQNVDIKTVWDAIEGA